MTEEQRDTGMVKVLAENVEYQYEQRFKIVRGRVQYRHADGRMGEPVTRLNFERGNAAAVLLHDPARDTLLFVRQFRYPVYASLPADEQQGEGAGKAWLLEIIAGVQEAGQDMEEVARREAEEEAGYQIQGELERAGEVYASPGGSSERVAIFLAAVDSSRRQGQGGGLAKEGEDTELVELPYAQVMEMLARGEIRDAKTVIALQYLALKKVDRVKNGQTFDEATRARRKSE